MGKCFLEVKEYEKAKNAFLKLLVLGWYLNDTYLEIISYD